MKYLNLLFFLFGLLICPWTMHASTETGALVVTYRTDTKMERLERIRFFLKSEESTKKSLYPKENLFIDDIQDHSRMVVIEDLKPGNYTLQFLVPNTDGYFEEVPPRKFTISKEETIKIDQQIKPIHATRKTNSSNDQTSSDSKEIEKPLKPFLVSENDPINDRRQEQDPEMDDRFSLTVTSNIAKAVYHLSSGPVTPTQKGQGRSYTFKNLRPGTYHLNFSTEDPFFAAPEPLKIVLTEPQNKMKVNSLFQTLGKLTVLSNIDKGQVDVSSMGNWEKSASAAIKDGSSEVYLPEGEYRLFFKAEDPSKTPPHPLDIEVLSLKTTEINAYYEQAPDKDPVE